jgi:hypothetical protein
MNMNYYNHRNSLGKFTRKFTRAPDGKFTSPFKVVSGRLYGFRGLTVRALQKDTQSGKRLISAHRTLFGFCNDTELQKINKRKVENYLAAA